jgi:hypothetical protein
MTMLNLRTAFGDCDLTFALAGFERGYDDLLPGAGVRRVGDVTVKVAALEDIIRSKSAANRPKDQEALPELEALARRLRLNAERRPPQIGL